MKGQIRDHLRRAEVARDHEIHHRHEIHWRRATFLIEVLNFDLKFSALVVIDNLLRISGQAMMDGDAKSARAALHSAVDHFAAAMADGVSPDDFA